MADEKVTIQLVLEKEDAEKVLKALPKDAKKSGAKSGKEFTEGLGGGIKGGLSGIKSALGGLSGVLAGVTAAFGAALTIREFTQAAIRQEDAVNRLNAALRQNGEFSESTSADLQNFASQLQNITRIGDEAALEQLALAQSFGASAEQSKLILTAAADLSAAFGIDLESAVRNVSKTLGGYAGELGEVLPELKNLSQEQLRAGQGIDLIAAKFSGFAEQEAQSFSGSLDQAGNAIGDLFEELGFFITRSDSSTGAVSAFTEAIQTATSVVRRLRIALGGQAELVDYQKRLGEIDAELQDLSAAQEKAAKNAELFKNAGIPVRDFTEDIKLLKQERETVAAQIKEIEDAEKSQAQTRRGLAGATNELSEAEKKLRTDALALQTTNDPLAQQEAELNRQNELLTAANEQKLIGEEDFLLRQNALKEQFAQLDAARTERQVSQSIAATDQQESSLNQLGTAFGVAAKGIKVSALDIAKTSLGIISNGVGKAFQNVGAALANGENGFKAFAEGIKSIFADIASATGDLFIKQGVGFLFTNPAAGAGLIAAGAGLKVLAGFLGGSGGGGGVGAAAGTTAAAGTPAFDFATGISDSEPEIDEERQTRSTVNVNVQGDVLDSDETGLRIVELINQGLERDGAIVVRES
jgi:phage-related minor tail protein